MVWSLTTVREPKALDKKKLSMLPNTNGDERLHLSHVSSFQHNPSLQG